MTTLGNVTLWLTLLLGLWGSGAGFLAATRRDDTLLSSALRTPLALLGVLSVVLVSLLAGVVRYDLNLAFVTTHLTRTLPLPYALGTLAASVPGMLLTVAWIVALVMSASLWRGSAPAPAARLVRFGSTAIAAIAVVVLWAAPFARLGYTPLEGQGLEPMPRHPLALVELALSGAGIAALGVAAVMTGARRVVAAGPLAAGWVLMSAGLGLRLWRRYAVLVLEAGEAGLIGLVFVWVLAGAALYGRRRGEVGQRVVWAGLGLIVLAAGGRALGSSSEIRLTTGTETTIPVPGGAVTLSSLGVSRFEIPGGMTSAATLTARGAGAATLLTTEQRQYVDIFGHHLGVPETRPGMLHGVLADLRVAYAASPMDLATRSPPNEAVFRVRVLPLAWSAWLGFTLLVTGGLLTAAGRRDRSP